MNVIRFWYRNARPVSLPQSLLPSVLAVCLSFSTPAFSWWLALLAVVGVALAHLSLNLFDDYFDYRKNKTDYR
ncbi:MAG: prenyltransferase, partial [Bacteroidales bacterium]|nr:prenyltransferase [Bacteroidales bacterium]